MGLEVVLVCAFLCMLPLNSGSNDCFNIQLRVPTSSINGYLQNPGFNRGVPYALARNGQNICKSCKGSICYGNCNSSGQIRFEPPQKALTVSVPSDKSPSGRLTITIDTRKPCPGDEVVPDLPPADNGETSKETVDVDIQFVPNANAGGNLSVSTSGQSSAIKDINGERLSTNTNGAINIPGSNEAILVTVNVNDENTGKTPRHTSLTSDITANDGIGDVSKTDTEADIIDIPIDSSDGSDSPVTGNKPDQPAPAPADNPKPDDSEKPPAEEENPGSPPPSGGNKPNASSGTVSEAAADDETAAADSASGAAADSG